MPPGSWAPSGFLWGQDVWTWKEGTQFGTVGVKGGMVCERAVGVLIKKKIFFWKVFYSFFLFQCKNNLLQKRSMEVVSPGPAHC